jgi:hypothetical protein
MTRNCHKAVKIKPPSLPAGKMVVCYCYHVTTCGEVEVAIFNPLMLVI